MAITPATTIAAARKAIAEGEAILRETCERYGLTGQDRRGPFTRRWERGEIGRGSEDAPSGDYVLSGFDRENAAAVAALLRLARSSGNAALRKACFHGAGVHLGWLRYYAPGDRDPRDRREWIEIVKGECKLSVRRAYQLVAATKGAKSLDRLRTENAARERKRRKSASKKR